MVIAKQIDLVIAKQIDLTCFGNYLKANVSNETLKGLNKIYDPKFFWNNVDADIKEWCGRITNLWD